MLLLRHSLEHNLRGANQSNGHLFKVFAFAHKALPISWPFFCVLDLGHGTAAVAAASRTTSNANGEITATTNLLPQVD